MRRPRATGIGVATAAALVVAIAVAPRPSASAPMGASGVPALTIEEESAIGWVAAGPAAQRHGGAVAPDDPLQRRVQAIGDRLAASDVARATPWRFAFTVLESSDALAFALPGGEIFLSRGMVAVLEGETDPIAAMLAHQMGHVLARHAVAQLAALPETAPLVRRLARTGLEDSTLATAALALVDRAPLDRDAEPEADVLALQLLHSAGMGTAAAITVVHIPNAPAGFHGPAADPERREQRLAGAIGIFR